MSPARVLQACGLVVGAGAVRGDEGALLAVLALSVLVLVRLLWGLVPARRGRLVAAEDTDRAEAFPAYRRLYGTVLLSRSSARHVDLALRPVVQRILAAQLEDAGVERVRAKVGEKVWHLADPERPGSSDSRAGGLSKADLHEILDRLEST